MTSKPEMFTNAQVRLLETIARGLGARDKEEAIIHLLEKKLCGSPDCSKDYGHNTCQLWLDAIALIKGEESNNEEFSGTSISNHVAKQRRTIRRYP